MQVLLTGFEPFGGETINPSWEVVRLLAEEKIEGVRVSKRKLPTVFGRAGAEIIKAVKEVKPAAVIAVGQAGGRASIAVERVALNIADAGIADNEGNQPVDFPLIPDGPAAYFATLPIKAVVGEIKKAGIPAVVSNSAGTFVCNHVFYELLHYIAEGNLPIQAGFIHIPFLPQQAVHHKNAPSMNLQDLISAFLAVLKLLKERQT